MKPALDVWCEPHLGQMFFSATVGFVLMNSFLAKTSATDFLWSML